MADHAEPDAIGARARAIRKRRGLSLDAAAGLAGISKPYLSQLETGARRFTRRGLIEDLAGALGCSVTDLTGQPYFPEDRDTADTRAALPELRIALNNYGPDEVPDVRPRPLDALTEWADAANEHCAQARYSLASREVDHLVLETQASALTVGAADRPRAFCAAVTACFVAGVVASRAGNVDLAAVAARRGFDLARQQDDAGLLGFARWYWSMELTTLAARDRAQSVLSTGIDELTSVVDLSGTDTLPVETLGMLHLQEARNAARLHDADGAHAHLSEADALAARVGERNGLRQHFGPTNVAAWRVSIGLELGEGAQAYADATAFPLDIDALGSRERSSSLYLDFARLLAQDDGTRDGEAVRHLDTADRLAPQRVRPDPLARELVLTLDQRARRRVWELDSLRNRFGLR